MIFGVSVLLRSAAAMTSIITWGVPTMFTVFSFSLFTYYIARLNVQIEKRNKEGSRGGILRGESVSRRAGA
jgi:uncharacterized membrane protein YjfL (UPF0719 family)